MRWAVLGAGSVSPSHIDALVACPEADLVAICDRHPERASALAQRHGAEVFTSIESLLAADVADAVTIALQTPYHVESTLAAAAHGLHVLCEKPLAASVNDCLTMIDTCAARGVELGVIHNYRGLALSRWIADHHTAGAFRIQRVHVDGELALNMSDRDLVLTIGVHYLDLIHWWLGPPVAISASRGPDGLTARVQATEGLGEICLRSRRRSRGVTIEVTTDHGRLAYDHRGVLACDGELPELPPADDPIPKVRFGPGHRVVIGEAAAALAAELPLPLSGEIGLEAVLSCERVLEAADHSHPYRG